MPLKQWLKNRPKLYNLLLFILNNINYFNIRFNASFPSYRLTERWRERINLVKTCPDNEKLHHAAEAGNIFKNYQVMHNGLKIMLGSYYDYGNTILLQENRGVHEPQEEYVFQEVLKHLPEKAVMFELGSYWAFYSMWFAKEIKDARCHMVEPDPHKMNFGKLNFKLNQLSGIFDLGFIDEYTNVGQNIPTYNVDYLVRKHKVDFIHVLHSDIQGYEYKMLKGATQSIRENRIGYIFISTHSNLLHQQCAELLLQQNFDIVCSVDLDQTFSWDGLLVAKSKFIDGPERIEISARNL